MSKKLLSEDTVIIWNAHPLSKYRDFFMQALGGEVLNTVGDFQKWLYLNHTGKTLKEVLEEHSRNYEAKSMEELMSERRFEIVSEPDKAFLTAFDEAMIALGYDCENRIGSMIIYGKTGTKSRPCPARIYIQLDGIVLRLFLNNVDKHRDFIESAPAHIKDAFHFKGGDCKSCNTACAPGKMYTIDGKLMRKCNHATFYFAKPSLEKLPDYMMLLSKFYPPKKTKQPF